MAPLGWVVDPLLECALVMRHALCATPEPHLLAQIVTAASADGAVSARDTNFQRNAVAHLKAGHPRANGHNDTGRLVAERERHASTEVAIGELLVI